MSKVLSLLRACHTVPCCSSLSIHHLLNSGFHHYNNITFLFYVFDAEKGMKMRITYYILIRNLITKHTCSLFQCMVALQSSPLPEAAEILDILHQIEFESLFYTHDKLAERQVGF